MKKKNLVIILFAVLMVLVSCGKSDSNNDLQSSKTSMKGADAVKSIFKKYMSVEDGKIKIADPTGMPGITGKAEEIDLTAVAVYPMLLVGKGFEGVTATGWVYGNTQNPKLGDSKVKVIDVFKKHERFKFENTNEKQKNIALHLSGLTPNTTYYIRGFVKHGGKVSYSHNELKITTQKEDRTGGSYSFK